MKTVCQELENSEKSNQNSEERGFLTSHTILHGAMQLTQKLHITFAFILVSIITFSKIVGISKNW